MDYNDQFQKYVIVDDQAYTKEKVLIYTIIATTTSNETTLDDILKYFESFGNVVNANLLHTCNFSIQFADAKVAAKVLQQPEHNISNHVIYVENDSCWNQPDIKGFVKYIQESEEFTNTDTNNDDALILKLNDFCLERICKELTLHDQINFALTCQRFCNIFEMISHIKYINLNMNRGFDGVNSFQIIVFGLILGPYIESMYYDFESMSLAKHLCMYCTNLKTLRIYGAPMSQFILGNHAKSMVMLKTLELNDVQLTDRMLHCFQEMKNLKFLNIAGNCISGVTLSSLVNLKGLSLNRCKSLKTTHFKDICQNLKNLKYLDIRYCHNLGTEEYQYILENLIELEILKFTISNNNYNCLARLPKLKNLEIDIFIHTDLSEEFLNDLVKYQMEQMENLKLYSIFDITYNKIVKIAELKNLKVFWCCHNCTLDNECLKKLSQLKELEDVNLLSSQYITDDGIVYLLQNCLKLKRLHLVHCEQLTAELIRKAFTLLQDQHDKWFRTDCLHMTVEDEQTFHDVIRELDLRQSNPVLNISFESSQKGCVYRSPQFPEGLDELENNDNEYEDLIDFENVDDNNDNSN